MTLGKAAAVLRKSGLPVGVLALGFLLVPTPLFAVITIALHKSPNGRPVTVSGTPIVVMDFGTVSAFEALPTDVSRTVAASAYTISSDFGLRVTKLLGGSSSYTMQARLTSAHALTWKVDGVTLSTTPATVATNQPYASTIPHSLAFVVPFSHAAGLVTTSVEVVAIAN
jgi:hypothetical protein